MTIGVSSLGGQVQASLQSLKQAIAQQIAAERQAAQSQRKAEEAADNVLAVQQNQLEQANKLRTIEEADRARTDPRRLLDIFV